MEQGTNFSYFVQLQELYQERISLKSHGKHKSYRGDFYRYRGDFYRCGGISA